MVKNKLKRNKIYIFLIIISILVITINLYVFFKIKDFIEVKELDASVIISDRIGFDLNSSALTFGKIVRGGSITREIFVENLNDFPVEVYISAKGSISNFVSPNSYRLESFESKNVSVSVYIPSDAEFGEYDGKLVVRLKK